MNKKIRMYLRVGRNRCRTATIDAALLHDDGEEYWSADGYVDKRHYYSAGGYWIDREPIGNYSYGKTEDEAIASCIAEHEKLGWHRSRAAALSE